MLTPLREKELTKTLLEVLATIAYKQPITRLEIDEMRSNKNSEYALTGLLKAGLIEAVGRKETVGRPLLYGTTDEFLKRFNLSGIDELPNYDKLLERITTLSNATDVNDFYNSNRDMNYASSENGEDEVPEFLKDEDNLNVI